MTAGLVMGIMLIPFVSSLSDDIINAVPQSLRDGIVGPWGHQIRNHPSGRHARRPAGHRRRHPSGRQPRHWRDDDRGSGGRGRAPSSNLNPFEAMTTVTVKIVSQLTGDTDFAAPETLVAFALGPDAVRHHPGPERAGPYHRAQIPGAIRMTDAANTARFRIARPQRFASGAGRAHPKPQRRRSPFSRLWPDRGADRGCGADHAADIGTELRPWRPFARPMSISPSR